MELDYQKIYYLPKYVVDETFKVYKSDFVYIDSANLLYNAEELSLSGNALYKNARYLKEEKSRIFNNTEAIFLFNQAMFLLVNSFHMYNDKVDISKVDIDTYRLYLNSLGNFVFGKMNFVFKSPIFDSELIMPFSIRIANYKNHANKLNMHLELNLGSNNNFFGSGVVLKLNTDIHGLT